LGKAGKSARLFGAAAARQAQTTPMAEAALFHRCRKALGLSQPEIARALLIASDRTVRHWEQDELMIAGPAWVALAYLLRENNEVALADKVAQVVQQGRVEMYPGLAGR
jgi:DNA-binding transcriptional regulator YiaG